MNLIAFGDRQTLGQEFEVATKPVAQYPDGYRVKWIKTST